MRNKNMDAQEYEFSQLFRDDQFEGILKGCISVYQILMAKNVSLPNDENCIRDAFGKYLSEDKFKNSIYPLMNYHFEPETREGEGRIDIKILQVNPYIGVSAYYIIECKRLTNKNLTGISGLNAEFVKNGICRFVSSFYSSYYGCNGMFGFVVDSMNIHNNITNINSLLNKNMTNDKGLTVNSNPTQYLTRIELTENFEYSYISKHINKDDNTEVAIYHLMFDFSNNIK